MFTLKNLKLVWSRPADAPAEAEAFAERRGAPRRPVFREAMIAIEDYYKIRAAITEISPYGARVEYAARVDLPSRVWLTEPTMKLNCWARVVWRREGMAGLEFVRQGE